MAGMARRLRKDKEVCNDNSHLNEEEGLTESGFWTVDLWVVV